VQITYNNGAIAVYLNNSPTASITGTYNLNQNGYFGFSASTGACTSTQNIKNVNITASATTLAPTVTSPVTYCQFDTPLPLTATGTNLTWYTAIGGTPLPGAPTPQTNTPGTTTYFVSQNPSGNCPSPDDSIKVIVNAKPAAPTISGDTVYCPNSPAPNFNVNGQNILWYMVATGGSGTATQPTVNLNVPAQYTWYASQTVNGCESDRTPVTFNVYPGPNPGFSYDAHYGCKQDTILLNNLTTNGVSYSWDFGDGTTATSMNPIHVYTAQGTYIVKLTATTVHGCSDVFQQTVSLVHPLSPSFTVSADTVCAGTPVTFTSTSVGSGLSYTWEFGDGTFSVNPNPTHTYATGGVFNPKMIITDMVPCVDSATIPVNIGSVAINIPFTDTTVCLVDSMTINTIMTTPTPQLFTDYQYVWTPATGLGFDSTAEPTFFALGDYTYYVSVTGLPLNCMGYDTASIHSFTGTKMTNITPSQTIPYGSSVQLNADGAIYYFWTPDDGSLNNPNINYPLATPLQNTTYVVHGIDIHGCRDSEVVNINIDFGMNEVIPSAFTPNGDGRNDVFRILNMRYQKLLDFRIYNRWGQQVFQTTNVEKGWDGTFNGVPQDMGVYNYVIIVALPDGTERTHTGTVTIVK
jgi:gliding motility-associated-like protein